MTSDFSRCAGRTGINGRPVVPCITCDRRSYAPSTPNTKWLEPMAMATDGVWSCPNRRVDLDAVPLES